MIRVQIKKENDNISELTVEGHASAFYFEGNAFQKFFYFIFSSFFKKRISLLCCAVSVLFKTLEFSLQWREFLLNSFESNGRLQLCVKQSEVSNFICDNILLGVYQLQAQYPNELVIEEV